MSSRFKITVLLLVSIAIQLAARLNVSAADTNNPAEIRAMVEQMAETGRMSGGYMMCIGNHIPWNVPADAVKRYLDLAEALAWR